MTRILCTICARAGSKGVRNKNIKDIAGKPLIAYSIEQAILSGLFDKIAVSSDSEEILSVAKSYGANYLIKRPDTLASDTAPKIPAIQHALRESETIFGESFEVIVDLDATSPLRNADDIRACVELLQSRQVSNVITGCTAKRSPYFNLVEVNNQGFVSLSKKLQNPVFRRQDAPKCYDLNASIYVWKRDILFKDNNSVFNHDTLLYEMPEERSVDIDNELDFEFVEFLLKRAYL
ncbi:acylneuraminate cytidylyltransferase family protein [Paenibacillus alginolyticus]|uniref:Acylneuraminate cytidylyltransferase family protein n=1 Tax=Paenibacillus alginolyticus TaxID=59839 RepID=A0ABT4G8P2_9BACL|nr:acylneuraminate cytidylyltransferase family protein [Paenibacillus alginolyticus]MCY9692557.1 acylneuraminate cytidylyltransferase family protein [Paenibacillus alginolyticus]MEC0143763.1 acylneuraminate cytidylyltransferase family protein [Paenibacillus alginolyticus]